MTLCIPTLPTINYSTGAFWPALKRAFS